MPNYISLLRGVNVSGKNKIKMADLRELYESIGFSNVKSYIQSGNITFTSSNSNKADLSKQIEKGIAKEFDMKITTFIKSQHEWSKIIESNPYMKCADQDISRLHVTFLLEKPSPKLVKALDMVEAKGDECHASKDRVYLYCKNGYGRTKLTNNALERLLKTPATTRNFKTVLTLYEQISQ